MKVPLLDLKAQYNEIKDDINPKVADVIKSQVFILGPVVEEFEKRMADYITASYAVGVSSGSDALIISLMALDISVGDIVITTPFTFFATAGAVSRVGARPVFCDINPETYNLEPEKLAVLLAEMENKERDRLKAVIPVHLYGQCADMDPIMSLAKKFDFAVIEDAAQAVGSEYPSSEGPRKACTMGDMNILSFFPSKNLGGFGDGGMVLTDNENLYQKLRLLRVHGSRNKYFNDIIGGNFRLDALQAAVLCVKMNYLESWHEKRREHADYYNRAFEEEGWIKDGLVKPPKAVYRDRGIKNDHIYNQYVIRVEQRDKLQAYLKEQGIGTAIYYPLPLHLQECFSDLGYKQGDFPVSEKAAREVLALPIYPELSREQQDYVVTTIKNFFSR
ncbi:MAG: DegT/DnrJ/EryC1/StrS family aminotransferase [Candidatus Aminicenantes bacterium]|nr:DegT/DnrJ/EryC1/StrS family aminotransferase [Candidatus Aminicenantes bacterium]